MMWDYDSQLLESVAVRRGRMRSALGVGRRGGEERLGKVFAGVAVAAVLCAGCVGWSFVSGEMGRPGPHQSSPHR
ncbi:hypothetical protein [Wenjunlia tyrosinilytica]|nr:hypothetical protein [Wenjunlia tyrosinilytica]